MSMGIRENNRRFPFRFRCLIVGCIIVCVALFNFTIHATDLQQNSNKHREAVIERHWGQPAVRHEPPEIEEPNEDAAVDSQDKEPMAETASGVAFQTESNGAPPTDNDTSKVEGPHLLNKIKTGGRRLLSRLANFPSFFLKDTPKYAKWYNRGESEESVTVASGTVVAVGDYNGDKSSDIFLLVKGNIADNDQGNADSKDDSIIRKLFGRPFWRPFSGDTSTITNEPVGLNLYLTINMWIPSQLAYKEDRRIMVPENVTGIIATDWSYDGLLDVIAIGTSLGSTSYLSFSSDDVRYSLHAYKQDEKTHDLEHVWDSHVLSNIEPLLVDIDGNGRLDLLAQVVRNKTDANNKTTTFYERAVWVNDGQSFTLKSWKELHQSKHLTSGRPITPTWQLKLKKGDSDDGGVVADAHRRRVSDSASDRQGKVARSDGRRASLDGSGETSPAQGSTPIEVAKASGGSDENDSAAAGAVKNGNRGGKMEEEGEETSPTRSPPKRNLEMDFIDNLPRIASPHSSAFVDVDGDCRADIVLYVESKEHPGRQELEFWLNDGIHATGGAKTYSMYRLDTSNRILLPEGAGQVTYADFNADGTIEFVVPACTRNEKCGNCCKDSPRIYLSVNRQVPLCPSWWTLTSTSGSDHDCRSVDDLCRPSEFVFSDFETLHNDVWKDYEKSGEEAPPHSSSNPPKSTVTPLVDLGPSDELEAVEESHRIVFRGSNFNPITLRAADCDADGFPDLIAVVRNETDPDTWGRALVLRNEMMEESGMDVLYGDSTITSGSPRRFNPVQYLNFGKGFESFSVSVAAFIDAADNSVFDVLATGVKTSNVTLPLTVIGTPSISTLSSDTLTLKATSLNGVRPKASSPSFWQKTKYNHHGTSVHGPTFKCTVTDIFGVKTPRIATQLTQSAHCPLAMPYVTFGLGRTNNFIDEFYLGMPINGEIGGTQFDDPEVNEAPKRRRISPIDGSLMDDTDTPGNFSSPTRPDDGTSIASIAKSLIPDSPTSHSSVQLYSFKWVAIIPNSQILTLPYRLFHPKQWKIELSVSPSHMVLSILLTTIVCLAFLGVIIWHLDRCENAEDTKEHQGFRRHFITA